MKRNVISILLSCCLVTAVGCATMMNWTGKPLVFTSANLEVVLTNQGTAHPTKSVCYRGNPNNVNGLVFAGIDIVSVANNHILDQKFPGFRPRRYRRSTRGF